jgi:hypothetical protein
MGGIVRGSEPPVEIIVSAEGPPKLGPSHSFHALQDYEIYVYLLQYSVRGLRSIFVVTILEITVLSLSSSAILLRCQAPHHQRASPRLPRQPVS